LDLPETPLGELYSVPQTSREGKAREGREKMGEQGEMAGWEGAPCKREKDGKGRDGVGDRRSCMTCIPFLKFLDTRIKVARG